MIDGIFSTMTDLFNGITNGALSVARPYMFLPDLDVQANKNEIEVETKSNKRKMTPEVEFESYKKIKLYDDKENELENRNEIENGDRCLTPFQEMLIRLRTGSKSTLPYELIRLISKNDLNTIYQYFLTDTDKKITNAAHPLSKISALKPGESYYLDKADSKLPRTLTILCSSLGELKVILETKSKLASGYKEKKKKDGGTYKTGGPAWRIDGIPTKYFNGVATIEYEEDLDNLKQEIAIANQFNSDLINACDLGPFHTKYYNRKNYRNKISVYSVHSIDVLNKFLENKNKFFSLTDNQKNQMISDLLLAVKLFHDQNLAHQDIKPDNVLVFPNLKLKLTDFGITKEHHKSDEECLATGNYESPEIARVYAQEKSEFHKYFLDYKNNLAGRYAQTNLKDISDSQLAQWATPDKANDIWALGIVIFQIQYGRLPKASDKFAIESNPLLKAMLECDRNKRATIEEAIAIHQQKPTSPLKRGLSNRST